MNEAQKLALVQELVRASVHSVLVSNGLRSGSEANAIKRETTAARKVLKALLNREPTPEELDAVVE